VKTIRLILGDQLNPCHSWFDVIDPSVHYVLMEVRQETDYVLHHAQKVIAVFAAMRSFGEELAKLGHTVTYLTIDHPENRHDICLNLQALAAGLGANRIQYQEPDEWRLDQQLYAFAQQSEWLVEMVESEHFLTKRHEAAAIFKGRKRWLMEHFYRSLRERHKVLMQGAKPVGDQWNFDAQNRKPWKNEPAAPNDQRPHHDHEALWQTICASGVQTFGQSSAKHSRWPLNRAQALEQLDYFVQNILPLFGDYQDAMHTGQPFLFHSLLSFALNTKMLRPTEVIAAAESAYQENKAPLHAVEGFIRQILGWREYVRGVYWAQMPGYTEMNALQNNMELPSWFWNADTRMNCLHHAIGQSLQFAYAHHIQRLMVIGNFALLAGIKPEAVHRWYLGVYIDAFEWVEAPNTLGMSQFADGGMLATKPYVSSAAYIDRMSDYCRGCHYDKKVRIGEKACPFNALYWDFYERHTSTLAKNPRIGMAYRQLDKMSVEEKQALREQAIFWREHLNQI
jgi:deoxyribodipyrimidine photolyase-related protein